MPSNVVTILRPNHRAAVRLFCLPHAGGSAWSYDPWSQEASEHVEICAVQIPGRDQLASLPPGLSIQEIVDFIAPEVAKAIDRPWAIFGHSMGAITGFELLRRLEGEVPHRPVHFFPACWRAPHLRGEHGPIHDLPPDEFLKAMQIFRGIPEAVLADRELLAVVLPILRADVRAVFTYQYRAGRRLGCPITAVGALKDVSAPRDILLPWQEHTSADFQLCMFPGDHFFLRTNRGRLLQTITEKLRAGP